MVLKPPSRIDRTETLAGLTRVIDVIDNSGVPELLQGPPRSSKRGRRPSLPQYTPRTVLIVLMHMIYSGINVTIAGMLALLWKAYTLEHLTLLGETTFLEHPYRQRLLRDPDAWDNEHRRLRKALDQMFITTDDTPHRTDERVTNADHARARTDLAAQLGDEYHRRRNLRLKMMNMIVWAAIDRALIPEWIDHWKGGLAEDETLVPVRNDERGMGSKPHHKRPATPLAQYTPREHRLEHAWVVPLTCAVVVSDPYAPRIPNIALGISIRETSNGLQASLEAIDAADDPDSPLPTAPQGAGVTVDGAYCDMNGYTAGLTLRGRVAHGWMGTKYNETVTLTDDGGPTLFRGRPLCPGTPAEWLRRHEADLDPLGDDATPADIIDRQDLLDILNAAEMPTAGWPEHVEVRKRGGQAAGATYDKKWKVRLQCPAERDQARCPIVPASLNLPTDKVPTLPHPPSGATADDVPKVCTQLQTTIYINDSTMKQWSPLLRGSTEHEHIMNAHRSKNERFNATLKRPGSGGLTDKFLTVRSNPMVSIVLAMHVAVANLHEQDSYRDALRRRQTDPAVLDQPRKAVAERRRRIVEGEKRRRRSA